MKSLVRLVCLFVASAGQQAFAEDDFSNYRLGNYIDAAKPLIAKTGTDAVADYYLGRLYLYGYGQLKNNKLAMRYFNKAAEKGYLPAVQVMAKYNLLNEKSPDLALPWFKKAASVGDVNAQMFMAAAYLYGLGVKQNADVASKYYIDAAKNGNAIAQFALAEYFIDSRHSANNKLGLIWLSKSAASGNPNALSKLGSLYLAGKLVSKDPVKGLELLTQAAAQNYVPAMLELGEISLKQNDYPQALQWFNKAAGYHNPQAYLHLAHAYLQEKSPIYDVNAGFLWTLKAAQDGLDEARSELSILYEKGIGTQVAPDLAKQWKDLVKEDKTKVKIPAINQAVLWLSNGATNKFEDTDYQMNGIFSAWQNTSVLRDNTYNQAPKLETYTRKELFKPQFVMIQPNEVPINHFYDALVSKNVEFQVNQWTYPAYPLNEQVEALEIANSLVLGRQNLSAPAINANYSANDDYPAVGLLDKWTEGWQRQANYSAVFNQLYFRAILGDAQSQFNIGQMFQYGIGVEQSDASAIIFYQNAAAQQHLGAEYNLGILFLQHPKDASDFQVALNWLTDAAFKGNKSSQYVLARLLTQGVVGSDGKEYIKPNKEQAISMLYIAASNDYGPAEYELAEYLARQYDNGLSVDVKKQKLALIRQLYNGAAQKGVVQAVLPLAFYNAMDQDKQRQAQAFADAGQQAEEGDPKAALLLGMLYDRGIGVSADPAKAMYWYQKAGENPVSQFILGTYATEGKGVVEDKNKGMALLQQSSAAEFSYADFNLAVLNQQLSQPFLPDLNKAYNLGNSNAGILLADYYLSENTDLEKTQQAKTIYTGLAEKGDQYAQLKLAFMLEHGLGTNPNEGEAQHWYLASAEQGNPDAQYLLGQFYQLGENGEPDYNLSKEWYIKASSRLSKASVALGFIYETVDDNYRQALKAYEQAYIKGDVLGTYNLALMYEYGKGVPVDYSKAKALFTDAANKGLGEAMNQLAGICFNGLGQARDVQQALSWYKKAAELGNSDALYQLGLLSETGVATKLDFPNALKYYNEAASKGNEKAMLALARMYHYGIGVDKDLKVSASIYQKLVDMQNSYAQYQLGTYYLEGTAGEHLPEKGMLLLEKASENGSLQAQRVLQRLETKKQANISYLEPVLMNNSSPVVGQSADLMYFDALSEWNRGDEVLSRMILQRLVTQYPNFVPAKRVYEQLNRVKSGYIYG